MTSILKSSKLEIKDFVIELKSTFSFLVFSSFSLFFSLFSKIEESHSQLAANKS